MTKRKKEFLLYKGYSYHFRRETNEKKLWRCSDRKCSGCIHTNRANVVILFQEHHHAPSFARNESLFIRNEIKNRAINTRETARDIIDTSFLNTSIEAMHLLPKYKSLCNRISEVRRKNDISISDLQTDVPEIIKRTNHGENFYIYDSGASDRDRVLIFSTASNLVHLENASIWIGDGTFRSCPAEFYQLYTIMAIINGKSFPLVYLIMKNKSLESYLKAFKFIHENIKKHPLLIIIDFEAAALNAFQTIFRNTRIEGCFFHFSQLIYRKVQKFQLNALYRQNSYFRRLIKMIMALAFVPVELLGKFTEKLEDFFEKDQFYIKIYSLWRWFKINYLENGNMNCRSIFSPHFWSVYQRCVELSPQTTNAIEGWHRGLNMNVRFPHPSLKEIGLELLREQRKTDFNIIKNFYSVDPQETKHPEDNVVATLEIIKKIDHIDPVEFLKLIAGIVKVKN